MRVLYLSPTAAMGGAERVLLDLLGMVRKARPAWPLALVTGNDGPLVEDSRRLGVATTTLPFPRDFARLGDAGLASPATWARFAAHALSGCLSTVLYSRRLRRAIADFRPDIIHSNGIKMHLLGAIAMPADAALVWHFHDYPSARPVTSRLVRTLKARPRAIVAVSESVANDIRTDLRAPAEVRTIWNSVDIERFDPEGPRADLDALAGLPPAAPGVPRIGLVATFARWKGHLLFLEMLKQLSATHPFRAYIVGGPLYETHASQISMEELRQAVTRLGLAPHVGLTGFVSDAAPVLRTLDVVVHASTAPEPFGLVIAEAMATSRAVVISDAGGVTELVRPGETGLTYASGSVDAMANQVRRLLNDANFRLRIGQAADQAAVAQFEPSRVTRQML